MNEGNNEETRTFLSITIDFNNLVVNDISQQTLSEDERIILPLGRSIFYLFYI